MKTFAILLAGFATVALSGAAYAGWGEPLLSSNQE